MSILTDTALLLPLAHLCVMTTAVALLFQNVGQSRFCLFAGRILPTGVVDGGLPGEDNLRDENERVPILEDGLDNIYFRYK